MSNVRSFIEKLIANDHGETKSNIQLFYKPINDRDGFIFDIQCDCIVVSKDTEKHALHLSDRYKELNRPPMHVETTDLHTEGDKITCSTNIRWNMLGSYLKTPKPFNVNNQKVLKIGLTGGVCSGKSSATKYIEVSLDLLFKQISKGVRNNLFNQGLISMSWWRFNLIATFVL